MRAFHRCFLPSFSSFGWGVLEAYLSVIQFIANCILLISIFKLELSPFPQKNIFFQKAYNHKHELPVAAMFVNGSGRNEHSFLWPSIDASYQVSDHLAKRFQRRRFLEIDQSETCLLMDRDKMSNLYREPSIDAS